MTKRHWRELVEIVGVVGIVACLLLLAAEVRQSNNIAATHSQMRIAANFDWLHDQRAANPEFARLFPKLEAPEAHLITATEASQIRGIAAHYLNNMYAVHTAYENGLLDRETRDEYVADFAYALEQWPGLRSPVVEIYGTLEQRQGLDVYAPIATHAADQPEAE